MNNYYTINNDLDWRDILVLCFSFVYITGIWKGVDTLTSQMLFLYNYA